MSTITKALVLCRAGKGVGVSGTCGEMKPLRVMSIHKSVCVTSFDDVLTEARGNIYADSTLISYVICTGG